jgi:hypothetical protein
MPDSSISVETRCLPYLSIKGEIKHPATISIVLSTDMSNRRRISLCFGSIIATHN